MRLDPGTRQAAGIINTTTRAELAPIQYALREGMGTQLALDSACSLYHCQNETNPCIDPAHM